MEIYCKKFRSPPNDIEVKAGESKRVHDEPIPAVKINDPNGHKFAFTPEKARETADYLEKYAETRECLRLAEDIRKIANIVEEK